MRNIDHQAEHPGCGASYPWDDQCSYWSDTETLLTAARADVRRTDHTHVVNWLGCVSGYGKEYGSREEARQDYIALVEGYEENTYLYTPTANSWRPVSPRRFADNALALERCDRAITVLVAYGEPIPEGLITERPDHGRIIVPGIGTELFPW